MKQIDSDANHWNRPEEMSVDSYQQRVDGTAAAIDFSSSFCSLPHSNNMVIAALLKHPYTKVL